MRYPYRTNLGDINRRIVAVKVSFLIAAVLAVLVFGQLVAAIIVGNSDWIQGGAVLCGFFGIIGLPVGYMAVDSFLDLLSDRDAAERAAEEKLQRETDWLLRKEGLL